MVFPVLQTIVLSVCCSFVFFDCLSFTIPDSFRYAQCLSGLWSFLCFGGNSLSFVVCFSHPTSFTLPHKRSRQMVWYYETALTNRWTDCSELSPCASHNSMLNVYSFHHFLSIIPTFLVYNSTLGAADVSQWLKPSKRNWRESRRFMWPFYAYFNSFHKLDA